MSSDDPLAAPLAVERRAGGGGALTAIAVIALTVGLASVWSFTALRQLASSIAVAGTEQLSHARATFDAIRARNLDHLRAHCRVMVEDPRLKSTLATEGMDEPTVTDILTDLGKLRRTGFLIILSAEGKVFAQAGADELRGLDLSGSSPVKKAQASADAVAGSWVIGGKVMDLSIMGVRSGSLVVAYLVVGQAVDDAMLGSLAAQTGVSVASATGSTIALSASPAGIPAPVFAAAASQAASFQGRMIEHAGERYLASVAELEDTSQSSPRLILIASIAQVSAAYDSVRWLILLPPALVFVAVIFAMIASRRAVLVRYSRESA
jgi:hypothetical protein